MLTPTSVAEVTLEEIPPNTQTKLVDSKSPKFVLYGNCVHSHKRHHHGHNYAHIHQHPGGDMEHTHSPKFWRQQERLHEERMSFLSFL